LLQLLLQGLPCLLLLLLLLADLLQGCLLPLLLLLLVGVLQGCLLLLRFWPVHLLLLYSAALRMQQQQ
jgi:hypothetical protein